MYIIIACGVSIKSRTRFPKTVRTAPGISLGAVRCRIVMVFRPLPPVPAAAPDSDQEAEEPHDGHDHGDRPEKVNQKTAGRFAGWKTPP